MNLPSPALDREVARRVLARLPHARRFPVGRLVPPVGLLPSSVRSLPELEWALRPEPRSLAGLDLDRLADWIEHDVGDAAGAAEVRETAAAAESYVEALQAIHLLIRARVTGARRALALDSAEDLAAEGGHA
jgi:hypothetical protein